MNYVEKLFDQVQSSFNLNAATLSGAIDILVIPQVDGNLKCTPFHVRFGKLQLISSSEKVVSIYVNNERTNLQMKLGHAGEAFFVEETEEPVPSILATSPITSPKPGRINKQSTEELVSEFMSSRLIPSTSTTTTTTTTTITSRNNSISKPSSGATTPTPTKSTSTATTTKEMKPLTEALEEMILSEKQPQKLKSIPLEDEIQIDSPIGSYIINLGESDLLSSSSTIQKATVTTTTNSSTSNSNDVSSDSETEPIKTWRWGGFPKFSRRKKDNETSPTLTLNNNNNNSNNRGVLEISTDNETDDDNIQNTTTTPNTTNINIITPTSPLSNSSSLMSSSEDIMPPPPLNPDGTQPQGWTRSFLKIFNKKDGGSGNNSTNTSSNNLSSSLPTSNNTTTPNNITSPIVLSTSPLNNTSGSSHLEPSFLVKQVPPITSSPPSILKESSPRVNNIIDGGEIFLLDEEQEQQERDLIQQQEQQQQQEHLQFNNNIENSYASIVKENISPINISPRLNESGFSNNLTTEQQQQQQISTPKLNDFNEFPPLSLNNSSGSKNSFKKSSSQNNLLSNVQLSLCGHLIQDRNLRNEPEEKEQFFKEYLVEFDQFSTDLSILKNPHLVAKVAGLYYPWSVAGHVILSHLIYNKPIPQDTLDQLKRIDKDERDKSLNNTSESIPNLLSSPSSSSSIIKTPIINNPPTPQPKSSWKNWWWKSDQKSVQNPNNNNRTSSQPINVPNNNNNNNNYIEQHKRFTKKTLRPTSEQLKAMGLRKGSNRITFVVSSTLQGTREVSASIYLWENTSKIVISDIDGTITKSDVFGQVLPLIGKDWSHIGVAELYSNIKENGYQVIYLTSRAIGQAALTRTYISSVKQTGSIGITNANSSITVNLGNTSSTLNSNSINNNNTQIDNSVNNINTTNNNNNNNNNLTSANNNNNNYNNNVNSITMSSMSSMSSTTTMTTSTGSNGVTTINHPPMMSQFTLPEGPVFMSPNRLLSSLNREVIKRNPEEFKIACLQDIMNIFPIGTSPFYAGFGNRITDAIAYNAAGVPKGKTFTINASGVINTTNTTYKKTYTKLNDLVQDMFPCQIKHTVDEQWNEFHYWKKSIIPVHQLDPI